MERKIATYTLIIAVVLIWGFVLYRLFFHADTARPAVHKDPVKEHKAYDQYDQTPVPYLLSLRYRDPFSMQPDTPHQIDLQVKVSVPLVNRPTPVLPDWTVIQYNGFVSNRGTGRLLAIIQVGGQERMMAIGERFKGLQLLQNRKDSVLVRWMGKQKFIKP